MCTLTQAEREAANRRIQEIKLEIQVILASQAPREESFERWEAILTESLNLQARLEAEEG